MGGLSSTRGRGCAIGAGGTGAGAPAAAVAAAAVRRRPPRRRPWAPRRLDAGKDTTGAVGPAGSPSPCPSRGRPSPGADGSSCRRWPNCPAAARPATQPRHAPAAARRALCKPAARPHGHCARPWRRRGAGRRRGRGGRAAAGCGRPAGRTGRQALPTTPLRAPPPPPPPHTLAMQHRLAARHRHAAAVCWPLVMRRCDQGLSLTQRQLAMQDRPVRHATMTHQWRRGCHSNISKNPCHHRAPPRRRPTAGAPPPRVARSHAGPRRPSGGAGRAPARAPCAALAGKGDPRALEAVVGRERRRCVQKQGQGFIGRPPPPPCQATQGLRCRRRASPGPTDALARASMAAASRTILAARAQSWRARSSCSGAPGSQTATAVKASPSTRAAASSASRTSRAVTGGRSAHGQQLCSGTRVGLDAAAAGGVLGHPSSRNTGGISTAARTAHPGRGRT